MTIEVQALTLGAYTVYRIEEVSSTVPLAMFLPRSDPARFAEHLHWLVPRHYDPGTGMAQLAIHSWLLRTAHHTILIDACCGNGKPRLRPEQAEFNNLDTPWLERLNATGTRPEDVDIVLCTHLHVDHVGWNTRLRDGRWVPTFPNARYLMSRTEFDYWNDANRAGAEESVNDGVFADSVQPLVDAGQAELIDGVHAIEDSLVIRPRPGHTPGHVNLELGRDGRVAVFTGDLMHHPLQVYFPDWSSGFCELPEQGRQSRRKVLERCVESGAVVLPAHFNWPHAGRIESAQAGFALRWLNEGDWHR